MAFHQPTRPALQRPSRIDIAVTDSEDLAPHVYRDTEASQTWVLFSPPTDAGTSASYLGSVQESQPTPGRSRLSDGGSLNTAGRSDIISGQYHIGGHSAFEDSIGEEDAELDSLDSHLPDFRSLPSPYSQLASQRQALSHTIPVLPTHDGLGSFRVDTQPAPSDFQEQLYAFERFNPRRVRRRRESLDLAQLALAQEDAQEADRNRRIEAWRLEHSQFLLDEIKKETRRRKQSEASTHKLRAEKHTAEEIATMSTVSEAPQDTKVGAWHDHDMEHAASGQQGLWSRVTRKVIRDLMGIDDRLLSILFGEALPDEEDLASTPKASAPSGHPASAHYESESSDDSTWHVRLLERVARELGLLVNQLSSHPGAFSTYLDVQHMPIPYAGLPVIPETVVDINEAAEKKADDSVPSMPQFQPTVPRPAQPIAIPGSRSFALPLNPAQSILGDGNSSTHTFTQQEWEQDLDIRLVFRYLRSRFTSGRPSSASFTSGTSHLATASTQDAAAKAARVRQHHPLVSHAHQRGTRAADRRAFKATVPPNPVILRHAAPGSCASQSTRRSARRSSMSSRHSSRHYWDIGGSMGTGSMIASTGALGTWGEV